jgi:hypothetical protein
MSALEMGMLADGTAFLTQGGLAKVCGVAEGKIGEHADAWEVGRRGGELAQRLQEAGYDDGPLRVLLDTDHGRVHAYMDQVVALFVEHYAFDIGLVVAIRSNQELLRLGLRALIRVTPGAHVPLGYVSSRQAAAVTRGAIEGATDEGQEPAEIEGAWEKY